MQENDKKPGSRIFKKQMRIKRPPDLQQIDNKVFKPCRSRAVFANGGFGKRHLYLRQSHVFAPRQTLKT
jgi:hypothetical protein